MEFLTDLELFSDAQNVYNADRNVYSPHSSKKSSQQSERGSQRSNCLAIALIHSDPTLQHIVEEPFVDLLVDSSPLHLFDNYSEQDIGLSAIQIPQTPTPEVLALDSISSRTDSVSTSASTLFDQFFRENSELEDDNVFVFGGPSSPDAAYQTPPYQREAAKPKKAKKAKTKKRNAAPLKARNDDNVDQQLSLATAAEASVYSKSPTGHYAKPPFTFTLIIAAALYSTDDHSMGVEDMYKFVECVLLTSLGFSLTGITLFAESRFRTSRLPL